jgi:hypothetical protein
MIVTMNSDFVAASFEFPDEIRKSFGDPPEDEECGLGFMFIKKAEETISALNHS